MAIVAIFISRAVLSALMMLGDAPDELMAIRTSPSDAIDVSWNENISSGPMSLTIAVISSTADERLFTLGFSQLLLRTPFMQSQTRWLEMAAEPPLPHEKIIFPWAARSARRRPAAASAPRSTVLAAAVILSKYASA
ncbi:hypothetical protein D3C85_1393840 [compost metagenome]